MIVKAMRLEERTKRVNADREEDPGAHRPPDIRSGAGTDASEGK